MENNLETKSNPLTNWWNRKTEEEKIEYRKIMSERAKKQWAEMTPKHKENIRKKQSKGAKKMWETREKLYAPKNILDNIVE